MTTSIDVWPKLGTTVTLDSGYVITAAGAEASATDEITDLLRKRKLLTYDPTFLHPNPSPIPPISGIGGGLTFANVAIMSADVGLYAGQTATLLGYRTTNDGGQGEFYWDAFSTTPADGGMTFGSSFLGRWKRILTTDVAYRSVRWFGAYGDANPYTLTGHDDTAAILAAWASLADVDYGARLHFPQGKYKITSTIEFGPGNSTGPIGNFRITGDDAAPGSPPASSIIWFGPAIDPHGWSTPLIEPPVGALEPAFNGSVAFQINGYGSWVENLAIYPAKGYKVGCVANIGYGQGTTPSGSNLIKFSRCAIYGGSPYNPLNGTCDWAVAFDIWRNDSDQNQEDCGFIDCNMGSALNATVWFRATTQPYGCEFLRCYLSNPQMGPGGTDDAYGIAFWHSTDSMSLTVQDCDIQRFACHHRLNKLPQSMKLINNHAEVFKKIIYAVNSGGGDSNVVSIDGGRYSPDHTGLQSYGPYSSWDPSDGWTIQITGDMSISLTNCNFANAQVVQTFGVLVWGGDIWSTNCRYPNMSPFKRWPNSAPYSEANPARTFSTGDSGNSAPGVATKLPTLRGCINGGGVARIASTTTFKDVTFALPEPDHQADGTPIGQTYQVALTVKALNSGAAAQAPYVSNISATGFRINVPAAVTVGGSIDVSYELYR